MSPSLQNVVTCVAGFRYVGMKNFLIVCADPAFVKLMERTYLLTYSMVQSPS